MASSDLNPFLLAATTPDPDPRLLSLLRSKPDLASNQDNHGYSLLHAAASYGHVSLLRSLVKDFNVDINLIDEDGETCLFVAESVDVAQCLVEELGIDTEVRNEDGLMAVEVIERDGEWPAVATYLKETAHTARAAISESPLPTNEDLEETARPPPLPPNIRLDIHTAPESELTGGADGSPDPEFRKRIEELAAMDNFHSEEGQRELRSLISDAVKGIGEETAQRPKRAG